MNCEWPLFSRALRALLVIVLAVSPAPLYAAVRYLVPDDVAAPLTSPWFEGRSLRIERVPLVDGKLQTLVLEPFEVLAPGATLLHSREDGTVERINPTPMRQYRGHVAGEPDSLVYVSSVGPNIDGIILVGERKFEIRSRARTHRDRTSRPGPAGEVFVEEVSLMENFDQPGFRCEAALEVVRPGRKLRPASDALRPGTNAYTYSTLTAASALLLGVDADASLTANFGGSVANTETYVRNLVGAMSTIYRRDLRTDVLLTFLQVWSGSDPFTVNPGTACTWNGSPITCSTLHAVAEYGDYWHNNRASTFRSAGLLLSGQSQLAGIAWRDIIGDGDFLCGAANCGSAAMNGHYAGAYSYNGGVGLNTADRTVPDPTSGSPNYIAPSSGYWPLLESAHELGHNVESPHTHCITADPGFGRTYVDECYASEGGCFSGTTVVPTEKGTIMSYCHLSGGGTQTSFKFGKAGEASQKVTTTMRAEMDFDTAPGATLSAITAPVSVTIGVGAVASVIPSGSMAYTWWITNGTFTGGATSATGSSVTFTASANPVALRVIGTTTAALGVTDTVSITANVSACNAPAITSHPGSVTIVNGNNTMLSVTATGTAPLSYQWYIGTPPSGASFGGAIQSTFTVANTLTTNYYVVVTNACGSATSNVATVAVLAADFKSTYFRADFDGNGSRDLLIRNMSTGDVGIWFMTGTTITSGMVVGNPGLLWRVVGSGDFDGNGRADLLIQNNDTGGIGIWLLNGATIVASSLVGTPGRNWQAVGAGDINGDGRSDIILRNMTDGAIGAWTIAVGGLTIASSSPIATPGTNWTVIGAANFDGNTTADLLIRNNTNGDVGVWLLNTFTITGGAVLGSPGLGFTIYGAADLNLDGRADVIMQNNSNGDIGGWLVAAGGLTISSGTVFGNPSLTWKPVNVSDFNLDNRADIVLQNSSNGDIGEWTMNALSITSAVNFGTPGPSWIAVGNR